MTAHRLVYFHARVRPGTLLMLVLVAALYVVLSATTVPSFQGDPAIPRARATLAVGCAAASLVCLYLRPVLWEAEQLAALSLVPARFWLVVATVGGWLSSVWLLVALRHDHGFAAQRLVVTAALIGIALAFGHLGSFWGLLAPWLYVVAGLAAGYESTLERGSAKVRPWAWLVSSDADPRFAHLTLVAGLVVYVGLRPRHE